MDDTRPHPTPTGNVEPTPEAGPLTPPTMRDHFADPIQDQQSAAAKAGTTATPEAVVTAASTGATEQPMTSSSTTAGASTESSTSSKAPSDRPREELDPEAMAKDVATRLKPVVEAAEDVATKALDLSAKGLSKLVDLLEERRRNREPAEGAKPNEPTNPS